MNTLIIDNINNKFHLFFLVFIFSPESASSSSFTVKEGDIILVATDGLFDNMSEEMILKELANIKVSIDCH